MDNVNKALEKELKEDIIVIKKANEDANHSKKEAGIKVLVWSVLAVLVYNVYSYTPYKKKLNKLLKDEFFVIDI